MSAIVREIEESEQISMGKEIASSKTMGGIGMAWVIWGCAALFYLYEYVLRVSPSVMTNELMADFGVTAGSLGVLVTFYYLAYVPLQIPCGIIVDWLGARRVITFSAILCTSGSFMFANVDNLYLAQIARFLMGAGSACAYLSTLRLVNDWFSPQKFALIAATTMMMGTLGGLFGGKPFAMLMNMVGWRDAMTITATCGIGVVLAAWFIIRDKPKTVHNKVHTGNMLEGLKTIASNPQSWLIGIYGGLMYVPISAFAELWGTPFLMELYNIDNEAASLSSAMVFVGMALGCPLGAWLSDTLKSRRTVMSWSALLTILPFMAVIYVPGLHLYAAYALLFIAGLVCGGQILYFAAAKEINPASYSATTIGFTNSFVMVSGLIFQPLLGYIIHFTSDGALSSDGNPIYTVENYQHAMIVVPICMLAAWFVMRFVKETYVEGVTQAK